MKSVAKSLYDPIDFNKFDKDIGIKKRMLELLSRERNNILGNYKRIVKMKTQSMLNLEFLTDKFENLIIANILRIQRWFRAKQSKKFFKNVLR